MPGSPPLVSRPTIFISKSGCVSLKSRIVVRSFGGLGGGASQGVNLPSTHFSTPSPHALRQGVTTGATSHAVSHAPSSHFWLPAPHAFVQARVAEGTLQTLHTPPVQLSTPVPQAFPQLRVTSSTSHSFQNPSLHVCCPMPQAFSQVRVSPSASHGSGSANPERPPHPSRATVRPRAATPRTRTSRDTARDQLALVKCQCLVPSGNKAQTMAQLEILSNRLEPETLFPTRNVPSPVIERFIIDFKLLLRGDNISVAVVSKKATRNIPAI